MNIPRQNALLRIADRRERMSRAARIAGWMLVYGGLTGCAWFHCWMHPLGGL